MTDSEAARLADALTVLAEGAKSPVPLYGNENGIYSLPEPAIVKLADAILLMASALRGDIPSQGVSMLWGSPPRFEEEDGA